MTAQENATASFFNKHAVQICLAAILTLSVFLRVYHLDFKSLWIDELYTIVPTNPDNTVAFIVNYCKSDQPPLFFLTLHYWFKVFPYTSFSGRMLSAIFGILGVVSMYFLGKEIKNERVGLFASFLTAINYFHIYYSQELRFYSLLFLLTSLSFLFYLRSIRTKSPFAYVLYVISTIALLYTQYFGFLIFLIQGFLFLIYLFLYKERISVVVIWLSLAIFILISYLPWMQIMLQDSQISSYWISKPKPYFLAVYYYIYWGKDVITGIALIVVSFFYARYLFRAKTDKMLSREELWIAILLIGWIFLGYSVPYLRSVFSVPLLIPRYTIVILPAIFLVMALGFDLIAKNTARKMLVLVILSSTGISLFGIQNHYSKIDKAQWREAAQVVIANRQPNIKVYSNLEWWFNYYFYFTNPYVKVLGKYSSDEQAELQPFIKEIENEKEFWVLNGEGVAGLNGLQQQYVDNHFQVKQRFDFFAASAILYSHKHQ